MAKEKEETAEDNENTTGNRKIRVGKKMNLGAVMMAQGIVKKGSRRKGKDSDYKLARLEITPADNGYMVTSFHEPKKGGRDVVEYREPKKYVYKDHSAMLEGISKNFND